MIASIRNLGRIQKAILLKRYSSYEAKKLDYLFHCAKRKRVILFSNPKSAGSTLKRLVQLMEVDGDKSLVPDNVHDKRHSPLCGILDLDDSLHAILTGNQYFRFAFVRNPFTRVLSCYLDKIRGGKKDRYLKKLGVSSREDLSLEEFLQLLRRKRNLYRNPHWAPQSYLMRPDRIRYNFIGRFEHLEDHLEALTKRLSCEYLLNEIESISVRHHRTKANDLIDEYIHEKEADLIRRIYKYDFIYFSYPSEPDLYYV